MKRSVFSGLILSAALLSPSVFAADLCEVNLQKIENSKTVVTTLGEPATGQFDDAVKQAKAAQSAGNEKECIAHTTDALKLITDAQRTKN